MLNLFKKKQNKRKKVVIFGLGSIGKRHLQILEDHFDFDLYAFRHNPFCVPSNIPETFSWQDLDERIQPDVAIISNLTHQHILTAYHCTIRDIPFMMEKPIGVNVDGLDSLIREVQLRQLATYVAYPLRFHPVVKQYKEQRKSRPSSVIVVAKSDFTQWPSERKSNGVLLELSHELDYAEYLFGKIKEINGNFSENMARLTVSHGGNVLSEFYLSIDAKQPERYFKVSGDQYEIIPDDNMYLHQLEYFFANLHNPHMMNNLVDAVELFRKIIEFRDNGM